MAWVIKLVSIILWWIHASVSDTIDAITFASTGSSFDFGNLTVGRWDPAGFSSPTRGVIANGTAVAAGNSVSNVIDFVTISSGNAFDFGDATQVKQACLVAPIQFVVVGVEDIHHHQQRILIQ